eukprot:CAMPEP_0184317522 /NCGR_PEP_ID=MMETSP1049-20130417/97110_1 /TAXON_ID=77928 /ORGANISM="Proteomonas sulcata, Strain CCMP704" /LENGTH=89 /DNA_ID=CAMNT_0026636927 /DNA_START=199 /DNA_END=468 /DNA_ORIENTATION=-
MAWGFSHRRYTLRMFLVVWYYIYRVRRLKSVVKAQQTGFQMEKQALMTAAAANLHVITEEAANRNATMIHNYLQTTESFVDTSTFVPDV